MLILILALLVVVVVVALANLELFLWICLAALGLGGVLAAGAILYVAASSLALVSAKDAFELVAFLAVLSVLVYWLAKRYDAQEAKKTHPTWFIDW